MKENLRTPKTNILGKEESEPNRTRKLKPKEKEKSY